MKVAQSKLQSTPDHARKWRQGVLVFKAFIGLLVFDALGFVHDFRKLHRFVKSWQLSPRPSSPAGLDDVCKALNCACVWYPKRVRCLQRSAVLTCLLRHSGVHAEMVMGSQIIPFKAHAWTEVNGKAINERRDVTKFYSVLERC